MAGFNLITEEVTGRGRANVEIHSVGESQTNIELGSVTQDGAMNLLVFDRAHGYDQAKLESQLSNLEGKMDGKSDAARKARAEVGSAKAALKEGDHGKVVNALKSAGLVALEMAKSIGAGVAEKAIEASLGFGG